MSAGAAASAESGALSLSEFFAGVRSGQVTVQRCAGCGALAVPPRAVCGRCEGTTWSRTALAGDGELASFTVIRVAPSRLADRAPYVIAVARMSEGVSLLGRLEAPPDAARVGLPVRLAPAGEGSEPVIAFRPR